MDVRWDGFDGRSTDADQRRRAPRLQPSRQHAARLDRRRPAVRAQEHQGQHAGRHPHGARARRQRRRHRRGQGRRLREQEQVRHAQPVATRSSTGCSRPCRPWARAGARPACWASASAARPRRRCCSPRKSLMDDIDMHELQRARRRRIKIEELRLELTTRSMRSASARRAWAASPPCSTSRSRLPDARGVASPSRMIPNCAATRHAHFVLDGSRPGDLEPPSLDLWPKLTWTPRRRMRGASISTR